MSGDPQGFGRWGSLPTDPLRPRALQNPQDVGEPCKCTFQGESKSQKMTNSIKLFTSYKK